MKNDDATNHDANPNNGTDSVHTDNNICDEMLRDDQIDDDTEIALIDDRNKKDCHNVPNDANTLNNFRHTEEIPRCTTDENDGRLFTTLPCDETDILPTSTLAEDEEDTTKKNDAMKHDTMPATTRIVTTWRIFLSAMI